MRLILFILACLLSGCGYRIHSPEYRDQYAHLDIKFSDISFEETSYFLVILVEARHLDYSTPQNFLKTLAKHPSDGSKNCDVGHAWIYLQGIIDGESVYIEGGHSGELGHYQPRYIEGVFTRYENELPDPISYLWETQKDGFFQQGSGKHKPTFAAKIDLTAEQFNYILRYIESYDFSEYAITGNQCSSFATQVAAFGGLDLECEVTMPIEQYVRIGNQSVCLWNDSAYSEITFPSPDRLERSLMEAVQHGRAQYALSWYKKRHPCKNKFDLDMIKSFPSRYMRYRALSLPSVRSTDS